MRHRRSDVTTLGIGYLDTKENNAMQGLEESGGSNTDGDEEGSSEGGVLGGTGELGELGVDVVVLLADADQLTEIGVLHANVDAEVDSRDILGVGDDTLLALGVLVKLGAEQGLEALVVGGAIGNGLALAVFVWGVNGTRRVALRVVLVVPGLGRRRGVGCLGAVAGSGGRGGAVLGAGAVLGTREDAGRASEGCGGLVKLLDLSAAGLTSGSEHRKGNEGGLHGELWVVVADSCNGSCV